MNEPSGIERTIGPGMNVRMPDTLRIWDLHAHLSGVPGDTPEARAEKLIAYADRMGVERFCLFMGMRLSRDPDPDTLRRQNDDVLRVLAHWSDRIFGFAYLNARHVDASLAEIERCVAMGPMVGIKLWVSHNCHLPELDPIIARAGELQAVIYQHTWIKTGDVTPGESSPQQLAQLAARHPEVPLICGHSGGNWELGIRAIRAQRNVSIGVGGSSPTAGFVEMAVRELGAGRVIHGSDIGGRSFASQLAKTLGAAVPDNAKRLILGGNLRRLLTPILQRKGIRI